MKKNGKQDLTLSDYGFFICSPAYLTCWLKTHKIRGKRILDKFVNNQELYLSALADGAWLPIPEIDADKYTLFFESPLTSEWNDIVSWDHFNLTIGADNSIWLGSLGSLNLWNCDLFSVPEDVIAYQTWKGEYLNKFIRFHQREGKYHLGLTALHHNVENRLGYLLALNEVESYQDANDPRGEQYNFNIRQHLR